MGSNTDAVALISSKKLCNTSSSSVRTLMIYHEKKNRKYCLNSPFEIGKQAETAIANRNTNKCGLYFKLGLRLYNLA